MMKVTETGRPPWNETEEGTPETVQVESPRLRVMDTEVIGDTIRGRPVRSGICRVERTDRVRTVTEQSVTWKEKSEKGMDPTFGKAAILVLDAMVAATGSFFAVCLSTSPPEFCSGKDGTDAPALIGGAGLAAGAVGGIALLVDLIYLAATAGNLESSVIDNKVIVGGSTDCEVENLRSFSGHLRIGDHKLPIQPNPDGSFSAILSSVDGEAVRVHGDQIMLELESGESAVFALGTQRAALAELIDSRILQFPPRLATEVRFQDGDAEQTGVLEATESATLELQIRNVGRGLASAVEVSLDPSGSIRSTPKSEVGDIPPGGTRSATLQIVGADSLRDGSAVLTVRLKEHRGFSPAPVEVSIPTSRRREPRLELSAWEILDGQVGQQAGNGNGRPEAGEQVELRVSFRNIGDGALKQGSAEIETEPGAASLSAPIPISVLGVGAKRQVSFTIAFPTEPPAPREARVVIRVRTARRVLLEKPIVLTVGTALSPNRVVIQAPGADAEHAPTGVARGQTGLLPGTVLAVFPFRLALKQDLSSQEAAGLNELFIARLAESGLKVIPQADLMQRLEQMRADSYKECFDESCQIELGKELAASVVLRTSISALGNECVVTATPFDLRSGTTIRAATRRTTCEMRDLGDALESVANQLSISR